MRVQDHGRITSGPRSHFTQIPGRITSVPLWSVFGLFGLFGWGLTQNDIASFVLIGWGLTQNDIASFVGCSQSLISLGF